MSICLPRRELITLLGGAAAWPVAARAQQSRMPVIGVVNLLAPEANSANLPAFRKALGEMGYVEGRNAENDYAAEGQVPQDRKRLRKRRDDGLRQGIVFVRHEQTDTLYAVTLLRECRQRAMPPPSRRAQR